MNIKSLLLGSAAALVAVSGARAADAVVVAEPEPAEYVRICDVYGAGYFYIPGTETCLRIGASMRYTIGAGDLDGARAYDNKKFDPDNVNNKINDTYSKAAQVRMRMWTGQETELGTLQTFTEFRLNYGSANPNFVGTNAQGGWYDGYGYENGSSLSTNFAYIQLGGFRVGLDESFFSTFTGYAGNVVQDTLIGYGNFQTGVVQYYFDGGNGFTAGVSLEEGGGHSSIDSYVPHVAVGAKWTQGWGSIAGVLGYDSNDEEVTGKVRLDVNVNDQLSLWVMAGYGTYDDDVYHSGAFRNTYQDWFKAWGGNWAVFGGGAFKFNEKGSINAQLSYDDWDRFAASVNVDYQIVQDFHIIPEVNYMHFSDRDDNFINGKKDAWGALVRFQRDF